MNKELHNKILKDFVHFLKKHNAYVKYRRNMAKFIVSYEKGINATYVDHCCSAFLRNLNGHPLLRDISASMDYRNLLLDAFDWGNTAEGAMFWSYLDDEWRKIYDKQERLKQWKITTSASNH